MRTSITIEHLATRQLPPDPERILEVAMRSTGDIDRSFRRGIDRSMYFVAVPTVEMSMDRPVSVAEGSRH